MIRIVLLVLLAPLCALAQPKPVTVQSGTATLPPPVNITNTPNAIINWSSFNISKGATTNFIQPSSSGAVLNRVTPPAQPPIGAVLQSTPTAVPSPTVQLQAPPAFQSQPPPAAPASASQAVQLPDGRIVFRTTPQ